MMQHILDALYWFFGLLKVLINYLLDGFVYSLKVVIWLVMSGVLTSVQTFIAGISFSSVVFQWGAAYADIPPQAVYFMVQIGFPEMIAILAAALVVRMVLNLIPAAITRV